MTTHPEVLSEELEVHFQQALVENLPLDPLRLIGSFEAICKQSYVCPFLFSSSLAIIAPFEVCSPQWEGSAAAMPLPLPYLLLSSVLTDPYVVILSLCVVICPILHWCACGWCGWVAGAKI